MSIGNELQADGAETAKALSVNRRRVCGVMKLPLDLERSWLSVHGLHSSHKYNGAVPQETRYIKTHTLNLMHWDMPLKNITSLNGCEYGVDHLIGMFLNTFKKICVRSFTVSVFAVLQAQHGQPLHGHESMLPLLSFCPIYVFSLTKFYPVLGNIWCKQFAYSFTVI